MQMSLEFFKNGMASQKTRTIICSWVLFWAPTFRSPWWPRTILLALTTVFGVWIHSACVGGAGT
jgi:hypothetical protein